MEILPMHHGRFHVWACVNDTWKYTESKENNNCKGKWRILCPPYTTYYVLVFRVLTYP